ncbi:hypothetical protein MHUMG1_00225 [Metarhizium humberi]|uniref:Uncharacterized protein n=1 Tax=Metarhizium humberi TaxID=2596975 RepID=A0A9P8SB08_9HYPO|nr:hypothetical protein MHUMG1_00225 [Metarhizium humberi]
MTDDGQMKIIKDAEFFDYVCTSQIDEETFHFLGFKFLHLLKIVRIQNDLIVMREHISRARRENLEKEKLSKLLDDPAIDHETPERRKQRLKFKFPSVTTVHHHTRSFEYHYYYLHDNAKHAVVDALCNKLRHWISPRLSYSSQERLYRSKEFGDAKSTDEISTLVDNLVRLLIALVAVLVVKNTPPADFILLGNGGIFGPGIYTNSASSGP